ncbi:hypothetical protein E3N88_09083 [Mikania micrantha]|uniref:DYW domain-containing protein n=1 Tax=Mikania micrantha TaxID=192012 RepID=A0A5N6PJ03_9ASTR|nr:hypothetical protein E3N88_09083 [Mikania micrantha]
MTPWAMSYHLTSLPLDLVYRDHELYGYATDRYRHRRLFLLRAVITPIHLLPEFKQCKTKQDLIQIHAKLIKTGRIRDPLASAELIRFCALSDPPQRDLRYALQVFYQMNPPNCFAWNTIIRAFCDSDDPLLSFVMFTQLIENSDEFIKPNKFTFPSVLKACAKLGRIEEGKQTHCVLLKHGLENDGFVLSNLVRMYVRCGFMNDAIVLFESNKMNSAMGEVVLWNVMADGYVRIGELGKARRLFDEMPERSVVSWNSMISGYAQNGFDMEALELFREMQMEDDAVKPNYVTLISVLPVVSRLGALKIGKWVHFYAVKNGLKIDLVLGSALIDMYSKCGSIDVAVQLFNMLSQKNTITWNSIINGLAIHGRANEALRYFTKMQESGIHPNDVTYISVLTACSHADESHIKSKAIYMMLDEMKEKLRLVGYKPDTSQVFLRMDDPDKESALQHHSEKIAVAFGLISLTRETTIKVVKNLRICDDCHSTIKLISRIYRRRIIVRDRKRFHHFENGSCSCTDYW